ncbi:hypothetical protein D9M70_577950 [compost metagenome]
MRQDRFHGHVEVQRFPTWLVGIEGRVDIHLDRIALWILEVHRPCVAVIYLVDVLDTVLLGEAVVGLKVLEGIEQERQLVDRVERKIRRLAIEQH